MMVTLPRTRSSTMKLRPVTSLTNLARTGSSTSWKLSATVASSAAGAEAASARASATVARILIGGRRPGCAAEAVVGAGAGRVGRLGGGWGRGRRELEHLLAAIALQRDAVPVDRRDARPAHLVADAVELLAVRRAVLDDGARLAALEADAPEAKPRMASRPLATAPRRVEEVALGDQRVVGEGTGQVRGDRGGGFGRRWRHVVDGRVETGGDPDPGQVRDEREESELEDEPVTPDEPHDGSAGSYAR